MQKKSKNTVQWNRVALDIEGVRRKRNHGFVVGLKFGVILGFLSAYAFLLVLILFVKYP